jgi:hypothetical protein
MTHTIVNGSFESWDMDPTEGGFLPVGAVVTKAGAGNAELVTNGHFASNDLTGWTAAAGWAATTGKAVHTAGIGDITPLEQNISLVTGKVYTCRVKVSGRTAGTLTLSCENIAETPGAVSTNNEYVFTFTANATDATSMLALTPNAAFNGAVEYVSVHRDEFSDLGRAGKHSKCAPFPSCDAADFAIDATPNVVTLTVPMTLVQGHDYHLKFWHLWYHDHTTVIDPAVAGHTPTVTIKTADGGHYLQADLTWAAQAYAFPVTLKAIGEYWHKRFSATPDGHTAFLVVLDSDDMQGATVYKEHWVVDNLSCEDVTDESAE